MSSVVFNRLILLVLAEGRRAARLGFRSDANAFRSCCPSEKQRILLGTGQADSSFSFSFFLAVFSSLRVSAARERMHERGSQLPGCNHAQVCFDTAEKLREVDQDYVTKYLEGYSNLQHFTTAGPCAEQQDVDKADSGLGADSQVRKGEGGVCVDGRCKRAMKERRGEGEERREEGREKFDSWQALDAYLIMPVQRLMRYPLLLGHILEFTSDRK
eukprot:761082-Hanusia_phi.AAC.10